MTIPDPFSFLPLLDRQTTLRPQEMCATTLRKYNGYNLSPVRFRKFLESLGKMSYFEIITFQVKNGNYAARLNTYQNNKRVFCG